MRIGRVGLLVLVTAGTSWGDPPPDPPWTPAMRELFKREKSCPLPKGDVRWACNRFVPQAMKLVYGATDFEEKGKNPSANDLATGLKDKKWKNWKKLGDATDQAVLTEAQDLANKGQPVIAVRFEEKHGHVTLVIPGDLVQAGDSWDKRKTPCVANWSMNSEASSFISKGMNYAWTSPEDVVLYAREDVVGVAPPTRKCIEVKKAI